MKGKILLSIGALIAILAVYFVWQVETYMENEITWRIRATQAVNIDTENIGAIVSFLNQTVKK